ncbi:heterokaryon incompatibility protein-domain-containing protein [Dactylonectria estremocensis]|uniref:Heterokaryon incompatibility protein-domain-containing protein n=1 Tax=Dactylonectria estremocensis TaxID=1079267 RepID=A0A9P9D5K9_9HYPO|nr:heterokaryon incompatibility protein-domain-containing protein [Dactylonectria estremocensis]
MSSTGACSYLGQLNISLRLGAFVLPSLYHQESHYPGMEQRTRGSVNTKTGDTETPFICDACRRIDFSKALAVSPAESERIVLDPDTSRFAPRLKTDCQLCRILSSTICCYHDTWSDPAVQASVPEKFTLSAFSYIKNSRWAPPSYPLTTAHQEARDCHILLSIPWGIYSTDHRHQCGSGDAGYVVCYPGDASGEEGLFRPQAIPEKFDYRRAQLWLNDCEDNHGKDCKHTPNPIGGMKLIDCKTLEIVKAESSMQWVALSYVWGQDSRKTKTSPVTGAQLSSGKLYLPSKISNAVQDAITVTTQLGFQYLWVDRYCINQDDALEMKAQIAKMGLIYRGAEVTIVAAAGHDESYGLPGVGATPRTKQDVVRLDSCTIMVTGQDPASFIRKKTRWWTRGWTFQEGLLSRRRLLFTEHQTIFECNTTSWMEAVGGLEFIQNPKQIDWGAKASTSIFRHFLPGFRRQRGTLSLDLDRHLGDRYTEWFTIANEFTRRDLSFDSDSLHAFEGIMDFMRRAETPMLNISGLPCVVSEKAEAAQYINTNLGVALCWFHSTGTSARRRHGFPSWTWAGWAGTTRWMVLPFTWRGSFTLKTRDISFEFEHGQVNPATKHLSRAGQKPEEYELDQIVAFHFKARVVPSSLFLFNIREKYDGVDTDEEDEEDEKDEEDGENQTGSMDENEPDPDDWALNSNAHRRFLLVVKWHGYETATRIGALLVDQHFYMDQACPNFFDESKLDWKQVRLV